MHAIEKIKKITAKNGHTMTDVIGNRSVAFLVKDIPENAVIDSVSVNGKHLRDMFDIEKGEGVPEVEYPRFKMHEGYRVAAVLTLAEGKGGNDLYKLASIGSVNEFCVHYHELAFIPQK